MNKTNEPVPKYSKVPPSLIGHILGTHYIVLLVGLNLIKVNCIINKDLLTTGEVS